MRSATTPPISENSTMGMVPRNASRPSMRAELVSERTSHCWATICMNVPILDKQEPNQSSR